MSTVKMTFLGISLFLASYLSVGYFLHLIVFPEHRPAVKSYFEAGDVVESERAGTQFTVDKVAGDEVYVTLEFEPHSEGPPLHIHTGWDELYAIESGTLLLTVDGEEKKLSAGDSFTIEKHIPHKPSNPFGEPVVVSGGKMPAGFLVYLNQVYGFIDEDEKNVTPPQIIFQMAVMNKYFDSYLAEGPPVFVQKIQNFLLTPLARLMGYKSYYEKYRIKREGVD